MKKEKENLNWECEIYVRFTAISKVNFLFRLTIWPQFNTTMFYKKIIINHDYIFKNRLFFKFKIRPGQPNF